MQWGCERCATVHGSNVSTCRSCEHTVFKPLTEESADRIRRFTDENDVDTGQLWERADSRTPRPLEITEDMLYSSTPEIEYESSPDLAPDGSMVRPDEEEVAEGGRGSFVGSLLQRIWPF